MDFEQAKRIISELSLAKRGKRLNFTGEIALKAAWEDIPIAQAIQEHPSGESTTQGYVASRIGPDLWKFLSQELGVEVKKKNLRLVFEKLENEGMFLAIDRISVDKEDQPKSCQTKVSPTSNITILGNLPPNVPRFYGRNDDFLKLAANLTQNRCVALVGAAGIGKSALASMYVQHITSKPQPDFQRVIWISLHHGQRVSELLESRFKDDDFETLLQDTRSLMVIDCGSTDLEEDQDFQALVHKFCVEIYKSSLLILSRNIVTTVKQLASIQRPATTIKLKGLADQDALRILQDQGIQGESDCYRLIESYRGNPQLLLLASERIKRFCGGKLESFMLHKTSFASDYVRRVIREYGMNKLTPTEQRVLDVLIQSDQDTPKWIAFSELMTELSSGRENASMSELIEILESWEGMSLIESNNNPDTGEATFILPPATRKVLMRRNLNAFASLSQPA
ncbi:NB-ARC domain-containing protein [Acaryochloris sp. CCMEE 5410]|uniref:NB-ARC domain-containing protein n=1 Tax=Acaryochloris sp. CCMEE 5410 TaxID=310037 RepID=UPI0002485078|nr:NB-ARC domain-containing protein [Acaryochloris sp. CCMEE 5410]KAI9129765.1 ATP-binding protein [Acaryochloris sp. CCMEE 5410]